MSVSATAALMIGAMRRLLFGLLLTAAGLPAARPAAADPQSAHPPAAATPSGRVGRLAVAAGKVELRPAAGDWSAAETNDPVAAGSAVRTGPDSRAAIEIGVDSIDLDAGSAIAVLTLDGRGLVLRLAGGHIGLTLRRGAGAAGIELPQGEAWLAENGAYEIDAGDAGDAQRPARVAVFAGSARLFAGGAEKGLGPGEAAVLSGGAPVAATPAPAADDAFGEWWRRHSVALPGVAAPALISPDLTGFAALADAGRWRRTGSYGEAWLPDSLPAGWAPYRDGRWRWFAPWGWTWIDSEAWGFAPFHYGRWVLIGRQWAWIPGSLATNPAYVPAAVAFLGTPGIGVSYAGGKGPAIGWFPLAPGEAYWPSYTRDLDYIRGVNHGDVDDPAAIRPQPDGRLPVEVVDRPFANRLEASVVPRPVFTGGDPVMPALLDLPAERLRDMPVVMGSPRIAPSAPVAVAAVRRPAPAVLHVAAATAAGRAGWVAEVRLAAIRARFYRAAAELRHFAVLHLRPAVFSKPRLVALRSAPHHPARKDEHKKKIVR